jgi:hypothetical protein
MMKRRTWLVILAALVLVSACASIVGIDHDYRVGDAQEAGAPDATADSGADRAEIPIDASGDGGCNGHLCNGACFSGTSCASCSQAHLFCEATRTCVGSCAECGGTIQCYACPDEDPVGSCEPAATAFCLTGTYKRCPCDGGAGSCPGQSQVCLSGGCETCGAANTGGRGCKNGETCDPATKSCN